MLQLSISDNSSLRLILCHAIKKPSIQNTMIIHKARLSFEVVLMRKEGGNKGLSYQLDSNSGFLTQGSSFAQPLKPASFLLTLRQDVIKHR